MLWRGLKRQSRLGILPEPAVAGYPPRDLLERSYFGMGRRLPIALMPGW
jgi:hypothetical protein